MKKFHTEEYIDFLMNISPDNMDIMGERMKQVRPRPNPHKTCSQGPFRTCLKQALVPVDHNQQEQLQLQDGSSRPRAICLYFVSLLAHTPRSPHRSLTCIGVYMGAVFVSMMFSFSSLPTNCLPGPYRNI